MLETYRPDARVFFTTGNSRRISSWETMLRGHKALSIEPKDPEPAIRETDLIAAQKIFSATQELEAQPHDFYLSADALIFVGEKPMKKPEEVSQLTENFAAIAAHGGSYDIRSHTVVGERGETPDSDIQLSRFRLGTRIQINPEKAAWLATEEGTRAYLDALGVLYDSQVKYTKIASGICVITLLAMGVVESLEGQKLHELDEEAAQDLIYGTAYTAIINVAPQALFRVARSVTTDEGEDAYNEDEYWEKLRHHPYLEPIVQRVWHMRLNQSLR